MNYEEEAYKRRTYNVYLGSPKMIGDVYRVERPVIIRPGVKPPAITLHTPKTKPLAEVAASDVPRELNAEDVATDSND